MKVCVQPTWILHAVQTCCLLALQFLAACRAPVHPVNLVAGGGGGEMFGQKRPVKGVMTSLRVEAKYWATLCCSIDALLNLCCLPLPNMAVGESTFDHCDVFQCCVDIREFPATTASF